MSWVGFKAIAQESERQLKSELDISTVIDQLLEEQLGQTNRDQQPGLEGAVMGEEEYEIAMVKEEQPSSEYNMEGHSWTPDEDDDDVDELAFNDPLEEQSANSVAKVCNRQLFH